MHKHLFLSKGKHGVAAVCIAILLSACGAQLGTQPQRAATPQATRVTEPASRTVASSIMVDGEVRTTVPVKLSFPIRGLIAEIDVRYGDTLTKGQKLAYLDSTEQQRAYDQAQREMEILKAKIEQMTQPPSVLPEVIESAQASAQFARVAYDTLKSEPNASSLALAKAKAELAAADAELARLTKPVVLSAAQERLNALDLDKAQALIDAAQLELEKTVMVSPCDCYVHDINITVGEVAGEGSGMTLINNSDVYFHSSGLNERDFPLVEAGQAVVIRLKSMEQPLTGKIRAIMNASGEERNRIALFDLIIDMEDTGGLKVSPGMTGQAEIALK